MSDYEEISTGREFNEGNPPNKRNPDLKIIKRFLLQSLLEGGRSFGLILSGRAAFSLIFRLFMYIRGKGRISLSLKMLLSEESIRMSAVVGSFTAIWKFLYRILPMTTNFSYRVNTIIAGSLAGLSILFEKTENRLMYSQAIIFRALQSIMVQLENNNVLRIPYGRKLFFSIVDTQIMYAHILHPYSIPESLYNAYNQFGMLDPKFLDINRRLIEGETYLVNDLNLDLMNRGIFLEEPLNFDPTCSSTLIPCEAVHAFNPNCNGAASQLFFKTLKTMLPVYLIVNLVPKLLFKTKSFFTNFQPSMKEIMYKTLRSGLFVGTLLVFYLRVLCFQHQMPKYLPNRPNLYKFMYAVVAFATNFIIAGLESKSRLEALAMYLAPKALESFYKIGHKNRWIPHIKNFEVFTFIFSAGVLMSCLKTDAKSVSPMFVTGIKKVIDKDVDIEAMTGINFK